MKTYLVDFENVKSKGLSGIDRLTDEDHVIIFYSENSDTISFEMHCMVLQAKAEVDYIKVRVGGKNALDFQLSTLLGYLVAKGDNTHIFVIRASTSCMISGRTPLTIPPPARYSERRIYQRR